ncbi:O-antigen ligase [Rhodoligotrophos appendicifer]|uniref:O-antigen ligase family protein n=1 Tax=Rhodoligotrophos appendicifer TaxID=987056 RepID=UPI001478EFD7|nr:O-antigen ligase family protein [Rhodoligotrophos appendicifer]
MMAMVQDGVGAPRQAANGEAEILRPAVTSTLTNRFLLYALTALIALSPLPFGGNKPLAWAIYALATALLLLAYAVPALVRGATLPVPFRRIIVPTVLIAVVVVWMLVQVDAFGSILPTHPLWSIGSLEAAGHPSVNPDMTLTGLMRLLTYAGIFWLSLQLCRDVDNAEFLIWAIGVAVAVYSFYGLILWSLGSQTILWYPKLFYRDDLTSTFVNRNSFATYAGLGCVIFLFTLTKQLSRVLAQSDRASLGRQLATVAVQSGPILVYAVPLLAVFSALILSKSRAGFASTVFAIVLGFLVWLLRRRRVSAWGQFAVVGVALVTFTTWISFSGEALFRRFSSVDNDAEGRFQTYAATWTAIKDNLWYGTGYNSFQDMFPLYRDESVSAFGVWDKAHDTYLEVLLGLGLPVGIALILAVLLLVFTCLKGAITRRRAWHLPLIAFTASVLVGCHALVDFSLQMAGVAITYAAILGVGVAQSWSSTAK